MGRLPNGTGNCRCNIYFAEFSVTTTINIHVLLKFEFRIMPSDFPQEMISPSKQPCRRPVSGSSCFPKKVRNRDIFGLSNSSPKYNCKCHRCQEPISSPRIISPKVSAERFRSPVSSSFREMGTWVSTPSFPTTVGILRAIPSIP